jgi:ATP-dependent DNA helicase RecQ
MATPPAPTPADAHAGAITAALERCFGFTSLRPLQREAIDAAIAGRDALVVLPTGGGKSLCYQLPPLVTGKLTVVVSPLIALMQDQVDGLRLLGYPAAAVHSNQDAAARAGLQRLVAAGELRLLFAAPERLFGDGFLRWLAQREIGAFAIDEAHCISQWGHDFRPEYRRLAELRERFPGVPFHAYTATATPRVREDIAAQLRLCDPAVLVGVFDRPNLTYRVLPRQRLGEQVAEAIRRHPDAAAIVYCIARKDTEGLVSELKERGIEAAAYHAGLAAGTRTKVCADFRAERLQVVVATVAFGMGIDRGDVRLVVHAAMPKSVEHYQQETGRAGRDGLPAECLLLYSASDAAKWRIVIQRGAAETGAAPETVAAQLELLAQMQRLAGRARCRHRALSEYFGQDYAQGNCAACDFCLQELTAIADGHVTAQKILSAVARTGQRFGSGHVIDVLRGSRSEKVTSRGHDRIPTFGLLAAVPAQVLWNYIDQLVDSGLLARSGGEYPVLTLTGDSGEVLAGRRVAVLSAPKVGLVARPRRERGRRRGEPAAIAELTSAECLLFETLRVLRRAIASEIAMPPFVVFSDVTLEELARVRPSTAARLLQVRGDGVATPLRELGRGPCHGAARARPRCNPAPHGSRRGTGIRGQARPEACKGRVRGVEGTTPLRAFEQRREGALESVVAPLCYGGSCLLGVVGNLFVDFAICVLEDVEAPGHPRARAFLRMSSATRLSFFFQYSSVSSMRPPRSMAFRSFASASALSCASRMSCRTNSLAELKPPRATCSSTNSRRDSGSEMFMLVTGWLVAMPVI